MFVKMAAVLAGRRMKQQALALPGRAWSGVKRLPGGLRDAFTDLDNEEGGQTMVFLAIFMLVLGMFTFFGINQGRVIHAKMMAQMAADSSSITGASWIARGMNVNSIINLVEMLIVTHIIYMRASLWTAAWLFLSGFATQALWTAVCVFTFNCNPFIKAGEQMITYTLPIGAMAIVDIVPDVLGSIGGLTDYAGAMKDLRDMGESLTSAAQVVEVGTLALGVFDAWRFSTENGATFGFMFPFLPNGLPYAAGDVDWVCDPPPGQNGNGVQKGHHSDGGWSFVYHSALAGAISGVAGLAGAGIPSEAAGMINGLMSGLLGLGGPLWSEFQIPYHIHFAKEAGYHFANVFFLQMTFMVHGLMCGGNINMGSASYSRGGSAWPLSWGESVSFNPMDMFNYVLGIAGGLLPLWNAFDGIEPRFLKGMSGHYSGDPWTRYRNFFGFAWTEDDTFSATIMPNYFKNTVAENVGMVTFAESEVYNPYIDDDETWVGMFSPHWQVRMIPVDFDDLDRFGGFSGASSAASGGNSSAGMPGNSNAGGAIGNVLNNTLGLVTTH